MKHEQLSEQQIPDDLKFLYDRVLVSYGYGLAPVTNAGVRELIERISKSESKVSQLEAKIAQARKALVDVRATLSEYRHNKRGVVVRCEADCNCDRCCCRIICDRALIAKEPANPREVKREKK